MVISQNFARCLAKISGDGYLYYKYIRYNNTCNILLNEFVEDIYAEFGPVTITRGITNTGTPFVHITRKKIVSRFLDHLQDFKSDNIRIPHSIKIAKPFIQKEYLRAFYDDEGSPSLRIFNKTKQWKRSLTLSSNSKKILLEIKKLLLKFDIKTNKIMRNKPTDNCFVLAITKKDGFVKFKKNIGFKHPIKLKRLDLIINSYGNSYKRNNAGFNKIKKGLMSLCRSH